MDQKQEQVRQSNLDIALKLAREEFARRDPKEMAEKAGGEYESASCSNSLISLRLLGQEYTLVHPGGGIESPDHHQVGLVPHVLLLHYLIYASGKPLTNELFSYKDIPGGDKYFSVFKKRVETPLLNAYRDYPEGFEDACERSGGLEVPMGDLAYQLQAFPNIPVTYIYWKGDEEFPVSVQVLFDSSIKDYLPLEDIVFLSEMLSWKLARFKGV
ncbi:MAG: DUF3786 domain-containing protein [Deltaproteobacteria bacterium]|nr:DUF3786 domain-containing protein [Deltaproteobacteria bacterium]